MPFKIEVAEVIAYRAAYICSNPKYNTLTIGPALTDSVLKNRRGEAVRIIGEKFGVAGFTPNPSTSVDSTENGL